MKFLSANSNLGESLGELIGNLISASDKKLQGQIDDLSLVVDKLNSEILALRLFSGVLFFLVIVLFVLLYIINRQQK